MPSSALRDTEEKLNAMPHRSIASLLLVSALLLLALLAFAVTIGADLPAQEVALNEEGTVYEINPGPQGLLWISDYGAEEIWALDPASGAYTVFQDAGRVSDARRAADGSVWWVDQVDDSLGRLWPDSGQVTVWKIPGATGLFGTAIDGNGHVWVTQYFGARVYRFAVESSTLCTYTLGTLGGSNYIVADGTDIWLGDWINDRIHRLDSGSGTLTSWALPVDSSPEGLAFEGSGHFWWADPDLHHLARLEPDLDRLTTYPLPLGSTAHMLAVSGNRLWYTEDSRRTLGRLDPSVASGTSQILSTSTTSLTPTCSEISPDSTATLSSSTGTASWAGSTYTLAHDAAGWWIHDLPADGYPWGVAASGSGLWMVDNGRQVLAQVADRPSVTACKEDDADGDPATDDDRTPIEGWTVYLVVGGLRQEPGQLTGASGCHTWNGLEAGVSYGVEEDDPAGWTPLAATSHDFGPIQAGTGYDHTFVNAQSVEVTACKLIDGDGELATTGDQSPAEGWTIYLVVDGQRQEPGQSTGPDGCTTWGDLAPARGYGVEEEVEAGWKALTPKSYDFGRAVPGASYEAEFVNTEGLETIFLPLIQR
jgi:streptogramin lyase